MLNEFLMQADEGQQPALIMGIIALFHRSAEEVGALIRGHGTAVKTIIIGLHSTSAPAPCSRITTLRHVLHHQRMLCMAL